MFSVFLLIISSIVLPTFEVHAKGISDIISSIQSLESDKDPKCHATASRLEKLLTNLDMGSGSLGKGDKVVLK